MSLTQSQAVLCYEDIAEDTRLAAQRSGVPIYDFTVATPDHPQTVKFDCGLGIQGRVTPFDSLYILDFYNPDGTRVLSTQHFSVWDVCEQAVKCIPVKDPIQYYCIPGYRKYEIRDDRRDHVIRRISFPPTILVE